MGSFKLGTMTLKSIVTKPETILYPVVEKSAPDGLKGHVENDISTCILCGLCERTCPASALRVSKPDNTWQINYFACVQCGSCVRVCPKSCLSMLPTYHKPHTTKSEYIMNKPQEAPAKNEEVAVE